MENSFPPNMFCFVESCFCLNETEETERTDVIDKYLFNLLQSLQENNYIKFQPHTC